MNSKSYIHFVLIVMLAHVVTYLVIGALAYNLIYQSSIESGGVDQFMRNSQNPEEFRHVEIWLFPAQILRGVLFGIALCPFLQTLLSWRVSKRFMTLLALCLVFSVWSVTMPGSGSIEGWLYLNPDNSLELSSPLLGYIEVPLQLVLFCLMISWRIEKLKP